MNNKVKLKTYFLRYYSYPVKLIILFIVYFVSARFGLMISPVSGFATLVWPPTGIALVALFVFGIDLWPAIFVGAFLVNSITGAPLIGAVGIGIGNTMEAVIGVCLLKHFGFQKELERLKDVLLLIIFASLFSTAISATIGVTALFFTHIVSLSSYLKTWTAWWIGDILGDLIVAPFLFVWLSKSWKKINIRRIWELIAISMLIIIISIFVFSSFSKNINYPSLIYLIFPLFIWIAIRFNPKVIVSLILIVSVIAILGTISGFGLFVDGTTSQTLLQLQLFMGALSLTMLVLASVIAERKKAELLARESNVSLQNKSEKLKKETFYKVSKKNIIMEWLRELSVNKKLSIIIILIILTLLSGVVNFWFGMKMMSSIRSYVGGEGLWSKAQKEATNSLVAYSISFNEDDYNKFLTFLQVNMGDKQARLELNKKNPNFAIVSKGFIQGGNNPNDVDDLIFLYRWFRHLSYMDKAIQIWTKGDSQIENLLDIGEKMHEIIVAPHDINNPEEQRQRSLQTASLIKESGEIDSQLTILENSFSSTLGEGSRYIKNILLFITIILSALLGSFVLFIAMLISRLIIQVDNAKTEFVYLSSHQLRTPATAIKWYSNMLANKKTGALNEKQEKYIAEIYYGNERMIKLINNLLSTARIEMGKLKINKQLVDVRKLLESVIQEQRMEINRKNQKINVNQSEESLKMITDPSLLSMILQNIISNSVKYTLKGGEIICNIKSDNYKILFEIFDNGIGIPQKDQGRVFEKLFRAANSMDQNKEKSNREGTGLGLYIVKEMTSILGGKIWFKSELNKGTTFYLELPVRN
ncbi:MAG: MASE1 domain-containing protein [Candidatus Staskawiczbacteria bacterium]|nr:MASE1 domain-containing protein [Candidatus Staskawiczbacteria bacterium]